MNEEVDHGYYSIEVSAENPETFVEARFYDTGIDVSNRKELDNVRKDTNKKELSARKIRGEQRIIVRDYISDSDPNTKTQIVSIKAQEILDPITRTYLGNYAEFWVPIENKGVETSRTVEAAKKQSCDAGGVVPSAPEGTSTPASKDELPLNEKEEPGKNPPVGSEGANLPSSAHMKSGTGESASGTVVAECSETEEPARSRNEGGTVKEKEELDKNLPAGPEGSNPPSGEHVESDTGGSASETVVVERSETEKPAKSCDVEDAVSSVQEGASTSASKGDLPHKEKEIRDRGQAVTPEVVEPLSGTFVQCKRHGCMCCWLGWLNPLISYAKKAIQSFANNEESQANTPVATKNITYRAKQMDPPHQLPIINGRILRVHGIRPFHVGKQRKINVRIHDLKLGEYLLFSSL